MFAGRIRNVVADSESVVRRHLVSDFLPCRTSLKKTSVTSMRRTPTPEMSGSWVEGEGCWKIWPADTLWTFVALYRKSTSSVQVVHFCNICNNVIYTVYVSSLSDDAVERIGNALQIGIHYIWIIKNIQAHLFRLSHDLYLFICPLGCC